MNWRGNIQPNNKRGGAFAARFAFGNKHSLSHPRTPTQWHCVLVRASAENLPREGQLAWKIAEASDGILSPQELRRFLDVFQPLPALCAGEFRSLNLAVPAETLFRGGPVLKQNVPVIHE
jgi:hypothetical protein